MTDLEQMLMQQEGTGPRGPHGEFLPYERYVDTSYYRWFASTQYPMSTGAVVSMVTLKYHF